MIKQIWIWVLMLLLPATLTAQELFNYGSVPLYELEMTEYTGNPDAVLLYDGCTVRFTPIGGSGFHTVYEYSRRIKILTEAGLKWATMDLPFYHDNSDAEEIYSFKASTHTLVDGFVQTKSIKLRHTKEIALDENHSVRRVVFPDARVGSVCEIVYKLTSPYPHLLKGWSFQSEIPVQYTLLDVEMVPFYDYTVVLQGVEKLSMQSVEVNQTSRKLEGESYKTATYRYGMRNLPGYTAEPFSTGVADYRMRIDFVLKSISIPQKSTQDLTVTWPAVVHDYLRKGVVSKFIRHAEKAGEELPKNATSLRNCYAIIEHIKENYTWNNESSNVPDRSFSDFNKEKTGNSAAVNLLLYGTLKGAGYTAWPVLVSTRDHGSVRPDFADMDIFNDVAVCVEIDGKRFLADATSKNLTPQRISNRYLNGSGLLADANTEQWIALYPANPSTLNTVYHVAFEEQTMKVQTILTASDYDAEALREQFGDDTQKVVAAYEEKGYTVDPASVSIRYSRDIQRPYSVGFEFTYTPETTEGITTFNPFFQAIDPESPLTADIRVAPLDFAYPFSRNYRVIIDIPEGASTTLLPKDTRIEGDGYSLTYEAVLLGDKLTLDIAVNFDRAIYPADLYRDLKALFATLAELGNSPLSLRK